MAPSSRPWSGRSLVANRSSSPSMRCRSRPGERCRPGVHGAALVRPLRRAGRGAARACRRDAARPRRGRRRATGAERPGATVRRESSRSCRSPCSDSSPPPTARYVRPSRHPRASPWWRSAAHSTRRVRCGCAGSSDGHDEPAEHPRRLCRGGGGCRGRRRGRDGVSVGRCRAAAHHPMPSANHAEVAAHSSSPPRRHRRRRRPCGRSRRGDPRCGGRRRCSGEPPAQRRPGAPPGHRRRRCPTPSSCW